MDWDKLIDEHFDKEKSKESGLDYLLEMIGEIENIPFMSLEEKEDAKFSAKQGEKLLLTLPKFVPTESWGVPNSENRKIIERFMKRVRGARLEGRINSINSFVDYRPGLSPGTILSYLVVLESLAAVMRDFGPAPAGFVFEGFLAALLGGVQVADPEDGSLPIQDIIAYSTTGKGGVPISLKLLTKGKTEIKGSYKNLIDGVAKFGEVVYVVAAKDIQGGNVVGLEISEFVINKNNILSMMTDIPGNQKLLSIMDDKQLSNPEVAASFFSDMENKRTPWREKYANLQRTNGYLQGGSTQWHISQGQMSALPASMKYRFLGELNTDPEKLKMVAAQYMEDLGEKVTALFSAVAELSDNLNKYFIQDKRDRAIRNGTQAVENAKFVQKTAAAQVSAEKRAKAN